MFGAFAPQVESALSGAGWQDSGSQSVRARDVIAKNFAGLGSTALQVVVHDTSAKIASDPAAQQVVARASALLRADSRVSTVIAPQPGLSISKDGRTAIIQAGAKADPNAMVRAADALTTPITALSSKNISVNLTGSSALWANFNKVNHAAMIKSEVLSWPVTMIVLVIAFGSLVAAGLPLMLTLVGLLSAAGALVLSTHMAPVSIWALNFAMMFALALGIDYALFIVVRFRAALAARADDPDPAHASVAAIAETDGHRGQGRRVQRPDRARVAVDGAARAQPRVPQHGPGHHALGRRRAGRHPDPAARRARQDSGDASTPAGSACPARWTGPQPAPSGGAPPLGTPRTPRMGTVCITRSRAWIGCCTTGARCCTAARGSPGASCSSSSGCWRWPVMSLRTGMPSIAIIPQSPDRPRRLQPGRRRLRPRRARHPVGPHPVRASRPGRQRC